MNLSSRIKHEWKNAGIIERAAWVIGFGVPVMSVIVWFYGLITQSNIFILLSMTFFSLAFMVTFLNISMRHERDSIRRTSDEEHIRFEKELIDCRGHYAKLLNAYSAVVEKMKQDQLKATYGIKAQNKSTNYVLDEPLFYKPFPEDDLLNEAKEWTKEWDEHCT